MAIVTLCACADAEEAPTQDMLARYGVTANGYLDASFSSFSYSGSNAPGNDDMFLFQQAGFTVAKQPGAGFGALLEVVATPYDSIYVDNYASDRHYYLSDGHAPGAPRVFIYQGFAQYAVNAWTILAGKFASLCGVENYPATVNANVTRSLLYTFEPITHTGVRATFAESQQLSLVVGINNGLTGQADESASSSDRLLELSMNVTPASKLLTWSLQGYYGRDITDYGSESDIGLVDSVFTWNISNALSAIITGDYSNIRRNSRAPEASWWGAGAYLTYAISSSWRSAIRIEYIADRDGYLSTANSPAYPQLAEQAGVQFPQINQDLKEATYTLAYSPVKPLEVRLEARYDAPDRVSAVASFPRTSQLWVDALYRFGH
jgi:hypothetical protein